MGGGARTLVLISLVEIVLLSAGLLVFRLCGSLLVARASSMGLWTFIIEWLRQVLGSRDPFRSWMPFGSRWIHSIQAIRLVSLALSWAVIFGSAASVCAWYALAQDPKSFSREIFASFTIEGVTIIPYLTALFGYLVGSVVFFFFELRSMQDIRS